MLAPYEPGILWAKYVVLSVSFRNIRRVVLLIINFIVCAILVIVSTFLVDAVSRFRNYIRMIRPKAQTAGSFYQRLLVVERQSHYNPHLDDRRCYALTRPMLSVKLKGNKD